MIAKLKGQADAIIVEIHAEATSEKQAMGWYLDGRVTAVLGTHTHVPTADGRILPKGTAFMSDVGMTGPYQSVLGREIEPVVGKFLDGMPRRFEVATGDVRISGALIEIDVRLIGHGAAMTGGSETRLTLSQLCTTPASS